MGARASAPKRAIILSLALQRAVERRRTEIVKLLLEAGAPLTPSMSSRYSASRTRTTF